MYIRATYKLKQYKYEHAKRNLNLGIDDRDVESFMNGDHFEVDDITAQTLIASGLAQKVVKPT